MNYIQAITKILFTLSLISSLGNASDNPGTEDRQAWFFDDKNTTNSGSPSNIKYFKFYDSMPDEITIKLFEKQNLEHIGDKKLFAAYGIVDPKGNGCQVFKKEVTGANNDITVCLPWWRIEREYIVDNSLFADDNPTFINDLRKSVKPPLVVKTCKEYAQDTTYPGGKVTCTSYYDKMASGCWDNPNQGKCYVDNCGLNLKKDCSYITSTQGETTTLDTAITDSVGDIEQSATKINLFSHQYNCPSGTLTTKSECISEDTHLMYPFECKANDTMTTVNDGIYVYCDESKPIYDNNQNITGFSGACPDGRDVVCDVNSYQKTTTNCIEPIYDTNIEIDLLQTELTRGYITKTVDVLSGEADIYSANEKCLRSNTVEDARKQELHVRIVGSGSLDDDIYVLRHKDNGEHVKIYCNMQHNGNNGNTKPYNGEVLSCIGNNGSYSFNQTVPIKTTDIVSVQQNSENENSNGTPFALGRNHYVSTSLSIDGIQVAPATFPSGFPYYPSNGYLRTWDNTTSTFSILFPFAGAYELYFYNKVGKEVSKAYLDSEDFRNIAIDGSMQLKLGRGMALVSGMNEDINDTLYANREDHWVEWGGGVYGGRNSKTGESCSSPMDSYVRENAVYNIIVKDLLTGAITPIPMVYPLPYPNRIFVSKLKVYEYRKYRCYDEFAAPQLVGTQEKTFVCSEHPIWKDYQDGLIDNIDGLIQWGDTNICEQNCRDYNECDPKTAIGVDGNISGFTCTIKGGENIGGDLDANFFSNKTSCSERCFAQNNCAEHIESNCDLVEEKLHSPVSDITGKTLYRKKSVAYRCEKEVQTKVGCNKYDVVVANGDIDYNFQAVGYETKDFSQNFEKNTVRNKLIDTNIFSGWKGKCVNGKKWDSSYLNNPMTIASYAKMAYNSYTQINGQSAYSEMSESYSSSTSSSTSSSSTTSNSGQTMSNSSSSASSSSYDSAVEWSETSQYGESGDFIHVTNGDLVVFAGQSAAVLAAPREEDYVLADKLMKGFLGMGDESALQAYSSCMASIGLSFPNLMAWSIDNNDTSTELNDPWKHPLRMTVNQLGLIASIRGEQYVIDNYMYSTDDNFLLNVVAVNGHSYINAGEIICAGSNVAKAMNHIRQDSASNFGGSGDDKTAQIAMMALSAVCPVCGLVATVAMDFYNNMMVTINTCADEQDAIQRSMLEFKTNKFLNHEQCHLSKTYCDKEASFFFKKSCVRTGYDYCCYDQITTRIFAEGLKEQLGKNWDSCVDITINDLKDISFRECRIGEIPYINKCFPMGKYSEFQQALFRQAAKGIDLGGLNDQVLNSMAIDIDN